MLVGEQQAPAVAWFDRILADVGDSQNLQESLSTFSGHIRRVGRILSSITEHSLVLLDEVSHHESLSFKPAVQHATMIQVFLAANHQPHPSKMYVKRGCAEKGSFPIHSPSFKTFSSPGTSKTYTI